MARRSQRYTLDVGTDQDFELTVAEWNELLAGGWAEKAGYKTARLRRGVVAWIRKGDLWLTSIKHLRTATAGWWRAWLYQVAVVPASHMALSLSDRQEALLLDTERERENEALLWRTFRNTRGANEFTWISAEHRAELLRALRPEAAQPGV